MPSPDAKFPDNRLFYPEWKDPFETYQEGIKSDYTNSLNKIQKDEIRRRQDAAAMQEQAKQRLSGVDLNKTSDVDSALAAILAESGDIDALAKLNQGRQTIASQGVDDTRSALQLLSQIAEVDPATAQAFAERLGQQGLDFSKLQQNSQKVIGSNSRSVVVQDRNGDISFIPNPYQPEVRPQRARKQWMFDTRVKQNRLLNIDDPIVAEQIDAGILQPKRGESQSKPMTAAQLAAEVSGVQQLEMLAEDESIPPEIRQQIKDFQSPKLSGDVQQQAVPPRGSPPPNMSFEEFKAWKNGAGTNVR